MKRPAKPSDSSKRSTRATSEGRSSGDPGAERFPAALRLRRRGEFGAVFERGKVRADGVLVVHAIRSESADARLGISVSKRVGNAPRRNRWKRWIREAFRRNRARIPSHLMLIVRPRRGADPDFHTVQTSLLRLVRELDRRL